LVVARDPRKNPETWSKKRFDSPRDAETVSEILRLFGFRPQLLQTNTT
jgi:hypothetical protein